MVKRMSYRQRTKDASCGANLSKKMPNRLAGRSGLALVEFQLGRRGFEFVQTLDDSDSGDIWAETAIGRISIEVKTTVRGRSWLVSQSQTRSEFFVLTHLEKGLCYVLTREEMAEAISTSPLIFNRIHNVGVTTLPEGSLDGWHKLGGHKLALVARMSSPDAPKEYKSTRIVRHILRDGSVKTYKYEPQMTKAQRMA